MGWRIHGTEGSGLSSEHLKIVRALRFSDAAPGWALLAVAFAATAYSCLAVSTDPRGPAEVTYRLQAESLLRDRDLVYGERDRARFARKTWADRDDKVLVALDREALSYHKPLPYSAALAPFVLLAPDKGPYLLNFFLLMALSLALVGRLSRDSPESAPYWAAALVFGTPVFAYARAVWPELFVGVLLATAYLLTRDQAPPAELPEMAPRKRSQANVVLRWSAVGVLTAVAALQDPVYVVFFVAFLILAFRTRTEAAWAPALGGFALVMLLLWLAGGSLFAGVAPWAADTGLQVRAADSIADVSRWTERLRSVSAPKVVVDPQLWLWNCVYVIGGRHVGVAVAFLPLALLAATGRWRRGVIWGAAGCLAALTLIVDPFNFFGGPEALGNRRLVPALIVCFFAVRAGLSARPALLAASLGVVLISPLWLNLVAHPMSLRAETVTSPIAGLLPFETSQRYIPTSGEVFSRLLFVRPTNDGIEPGSGESQWLLHAGRSGELMVAAAERLASLDLEFGATAATDLELDGGVVQNLLFRPEGGITFRVSLDETLVRHHVWGREELHHVYRLKLAMSSDAGQDQPFSVSAQVESNS